MHIPPPLRSFGLKPLELNRAAEKWRKCGPEIPVLVVLEVCLAIAGCAGGTASTPGGNPVNQVSTSLPQRSSRYRRPVTGRAVQRSP